MARTAIRSLPRRGMSLFAALLTILMVASSAPPAAAVRCNSNTPAGLCNIVYIGNSSSVWNTTYYYDLAGRKQVISVIGYFDSHKSTSVRITKFKICFSGTGRKLISPEVTNGSGSFSSQWVTRGYYSGDCSDYYYTRTLYKLSSGEMIRIIPRVVDEDDFRTHTVAAFYR